MKFKNLSLSNRVLIKENVYRLYSNNVPIKQIRNTVMNETGYELKPKQIKQLINSQIEFDTFDIELQKIKLLY